MPQFNIFNLGLFLVSLFLIGCSQDISNKKDIGRDIGLAGSKDILKQEIFLDVELGELNISCLLYTSPSPRDRQKSRMPSSA